MTSALYEIKDFTRIPAKQRAKIVDQVLKLERKTFPADQRFDYAIELRKANIGLKLIVRTNDGSGPVTDEEHAAVSGYLVYQRIKAITWLHKLVVAPSERRKGLARSLVRGFLEQLQSGGGGGGGGSEEVQLWVDGRNEAAMGLYEGCGFRRVEVREGYYGEGRGGIRMVWSGT